MNMVNNKQKESNMVVYSLVSYFPYEGYDLVGVFATEAEAVAFANTLQSDVSYDGYSDFGVVASVLGAPVDMNSVRFLVAE
jgi:hypothetical protein